MVRRVAVILRLGLTCTAAAACAAPPAEAPYRYAPPMVTDDGWASATLADAGIAEAPVTAMVNDIRAGRYENIHSVLLARDGRLVLEEYFAGYDRDRLHELHSVSKSVTTILVGIAVDQGLIRDPDAPVRDYFPDYPDRRWVAEGYDITVRHLLTMSAGVEWNEERYPLDDNRNPIVAMLESDDWVGFVLDRPRVGEPGRTVTYGGGFTVLLGEIVHRASGLPVDAFAETYLFAPLGITDYAWHRHRDGTINTQGGLALRPRDMAKIGQMMLDGGVYQGRRVVSQAWVDAATSTHLPRAPGGFGYGYQWYRVSAEICGTPVSGFAAIGRGGQYIIAAPALDLLAVFTSEPYDNRERLYLPLELVRDIILPALRRPALCP